ncbi:bifunctional demethylmenaquinone methyltransferase/2-methoxy-6-polyprenyl-1,4-benzoquinol methylase UbiE [cf. Phormidesmis sp. LEGE 11477]|uniref:bifunctional demethylmenaquinone methyltransferase/2-methoxy-6-polyprenyl-1,4-benzoquinol methylase UbiE n=1 Tax=cf. Phormidesmis sp. LEGE 11477 TaxID=1828680 RepID=UPI0018806819|nr:bifunctional demethylmenaquinone methyltransferase/2-methoxy-6-polyprenyl-1,4-benzoquinol methylase UbiE [cf. Phormidesmis sp. LEGE 11477]MBE9064171.1 bifunctional demethylmenaquinone methyltransferase/2-methoxy-6-polyprenyl-1,4-benzoquinol methylase UbiE [cf. Phormidesmis sp. LEGE 11477]
MVNNNSRPALVPDALASLTAQPQADQIKALFDRIAPQYDQMNQEMSLGLHRIWKQMAVQWSRAAEGMHCLDLCCGSGDLALLLARKVGGSGQITGVDFAAQQLAIAASREPHLQHRLRWVEADALSLPFASDQFDAATMAYGLRNLTDIPKGLEELRRVLKPGATAAILDFHSPTNPLVIYFQKWYLASIVVPAAERLGMKEEYAYIGPSVDRFPSGAKQVRLAKEAGFTHALHYPIAGGMMGVLVATR